MRLLGEVFDAKPFVVFTIFVSMDFNGIFIKFGEENHIKDLQQNGLVYCSTIQSFAKMDDFVQGDELEKAWLIDNSKGSLLQIKPIDDPDSKFITIKLNKLIGNREGPFGNLFCLYSLNMLEMQIGEKRLLPPKLLKKYESYLVIKNIDAFLERLHVTLDAKKLCWEHHLIEYKDFSTINAEKTIFQKDKLYEYQQEFRLFIQNNEEKEIILKLGDLSDISFIESTKNSAENILFEHPNPVLHSR